MILVFFFQEFEYKSVQSVFTSIDGLLVRLMLAILKSIAGEKICTYQQIVVEIFTSLLFVARTLVSLTVYLFIFFSLLCVVFQLTDFRFLILRYVCFWKVFKSESIFSSAIYIVESTIPDVRHT